MVSYVHLASMIVMGLVLVVVFVATARLRNWYDYRPAISEPKAGLASRLAHSVRAWIVGIAVLVLAITGTVLAALEGGDLTPIFAVLGLVVLGFLTFGVYAAGRSRGHPHAYAIGEAVITLGFVFLVALTGYLLTSFGA